MNPYMNKELLVMELLIRKDSTSELRSKRFEIRGKVRENGVDYIEIVKTRSWTTFYSEDYFYAEEISPGASTLFESEKNIDAIFLKIQVVDK